MKFQIIVASHGFLAEGIVSAVKMIAGSYENLYSFDLNTYETPNLVKEEVDKIILNNPNVLTILLADIKGGSIHNQLVLDCDRENVVLVSGINLALVLDLILCQEENMSKEKIKLSIEEAKQNITFFDKETILASENKEEDSLW